MTLTKERTDLDDKIHFAALCLVLHILDEEGEDAVSWYRDDMDLPDLLRHLLADGPKKADRLMMLVCTSKQV